MPLKPWAWVAGAGGALVAALPSAAAVALCFAFAGCRQPEQPLRIALNAWPGYAPIFLAQEKGFFRDAGVDVKLIEFGALADARRSFETGKVDGLATTIVEVLMARDASTRDLRIVRVLDFSNGGDIVVARKSARSMRDLRGARIGVELSSLGVYLLARAMEKEGMALSEAVLVSKDQRSMAEGLLQGQLDAVVTYPPESSMLLAKPDFHAVFTSRDIPGEIVDVIAFSSGVLHKRPGQVAAFLAAVDRAFAYMRDEPGDALRALAPRLALPPEALKSVLESEITLVEPGEQAAYLGEGGKLRPTIEAVAATLRHVEVLSARPEVADCIFTP